MKKAATGFDLPIQARSSMELARKFRQIKQEKADILHKRLRGNSANKIQVVDDKFDQNQVQVMPQECNNIKGSQPHFGGRTKPLQVDEGINQEGMITESNKKAKGSPNNKVTRNKRCASTLIDDFVEAQVDSLEGRNQLPTQVNQNQPHSGGRTKSLQVDKNINKEGMVAESNKKAVLEMTIKVARGKTMCKDIHARTMEEREEVTLNEDAQPIGPTDRVVSNLSLFLGTLARNSTFCPLIYTSWKAMPDENIERVWNYTKSKFILSDEAINWVKITVRDAWRRYKHMIKKNHFLKYSNMTDRLKNRPVKIPEPQFKKLCYFWSLETIKSISERNTKSRVAQKWRHRMGPKTFAIIRERMRSNEKRDPTQAEVFIETRKGNKGKELDLETSNAISQLQDSMTSNGETSAEAFQAVFGKEHPGSVRCFGKGVTQKNLKRKEEIAALKKVHNEEVIVLNEKMHNVENTLNQLKSVLKTMLKQSNPAGIDIELLEDLLGSSPGDENSAQKIIGVPHAYSSTSSHLPNFGEKFPYAGEANEELQYADDES